MIKENKKEKVLEVIILSAIVLAGIVLRIIPHAPNFTPVIAIALFSGVYFTKKSAIFLPVILMFFSDLFIGFYGIKLMAVVYGSFILCGVIGFWLKNHKKWQIIFGCSIFCSSLFFFLTNFAVFAFTPWYQKNIFGIIECYTMALPFFRNALLGDLFYAFVFFGAYELAYFFVKDGFKIAKRMPSFKNNLS